MIEFIPLGGADEIGASCFYLNFDGTGILLDCGIHPRKFGSDALPDFSLIETKPVDFIFLSHAHQDHIGGLPFLIKKFPHIQIYSTKQTAELAQLTLHNAVDLIKKQIDDSQFVFYTHEEIDMLIKSIRFVKYSENLQFKGMRHFSNDFVNVEFFDAGHILGSASVLIEYSNEKIFYTGDIRLDSQFIMKGAQLPEIKVTTLISETTYGSTNTNRLGTYDSEANRFCAEANKVLNSGGSVLIPVFALGKMQEILFMLNQMMLKNALLNVPVFTGGLSVKISDVYDNNRYLVNRNLVDCKLKDIPQENYFDKKDVSWFRKNPSIVLATSGMILPQTTSFRYTDFWLDDIKSGIFIVGYCDTETPGFIISQSKTGETIIFNSFQRKVNCKIKKFYFPAHAKREDLLKIFTLLSPQKIILIHGDENSKIWIGSKILKQNPEAKVFSAGKGKTIFL